MGNVVIGEHGGFADDLDMRIEELESLREDFASERLVMRRERRQAVNSSFQEGVEVDHVFGRDFEKTGRIAVAPSAHGLLFKGDEMAGDVFGRLQVRRVFSHGFGSGRSGINSE